MEGPLFLITTAITKQTKKKKIKCQKEKKRQRIAMKNMGKIRKCKEE